MALEIERKFLVAGDEYKKNAVKTRYCQGYLKSGDQCTVRIRISDDAAFLTVKGPSNGPVRDEFEYPVPPADAQEMLKLCEKPLIEKFRYVIREKGMVWEVDEFLGENLGLVVAEIELPSADQFFEKPDWVGMEVTSDPRYYNSSLTKFPFSRW